MANNRIIVVTGCFIDCPCAKYDNGGGFGASFCGCKMMDKLIEDKDTPGTNKWMYKNDKKVLIHPDCPLKKTDLPKPNKQEYRVKDEDGKNEEDDIDDQD